MKKNILEFDKKAINKIIIGIGLNYCNQNVIKMLNNFAWTNSENQNNSQRSVFNYLNLII